VKQAGVEMNTAHKSLDVDILTDMLMTLTSNTHTIRSVATKVKYKGKAWLMCDGHQVATTGSDVCFRGETFRIPSICPENGWEHPFEESDIALWPWDNFKGKCPQIPPGCVFGLSDIRAFDRASKKPNLTFVHRDPVTRKTMVSGLSEYAVRGDPTKIYYNISTMNGSCGGVIVGSVGSDGGGFCVYGVHAGTTGNKDDLPNYSYTFSVKN